MSLVWIEASMTAFGQSMRLRCLWRSVLLYMIGFVAVVAFCGVGRVAGKEILYAVYMLVAALTMLLIAASFGVAAKLFRNKVHRTTTCPCPTIFSTCYLMVALTSHGLSLLWQVDLVQSATMKRRVQQMQRTALALCIGHITSFVGALMNALSRSIDVWPLFLVGNTLLYLGWTTIGHGSVTSSSCPGPCHQRCRRADRLLVFCAACVMMASLESRSAAPGSSRRTHTASRMHICAG
jgi:hypothetical protein